MEGMHPNAQAVMKGFQSFAEGDMEAMRGMFTEDAVWHTGGKNKWSGDYSGVDAMLQFFGEIAGEATIDNQPHALLADDEHVVALIESTVTRGDESITAQQIFIFHTNEGVVSEVWVTALDQYALDAFWG